jgi:hypothetical protein
MQKKVPERPRQLFGACTCVIDSPEPLVAANLAVLLVVIHMPALQVVEQLARPAAPPRTIKFPANTTPPILVLPRH